MMNCILFSNSADSINFKFNQQKINYIYLISQITFRFFLEGFEKEENKPSNCHDCGPARSTSASLQQSRSSVTPATDHTTCCMCCSNVTDEGKDAIGIFSSIKSLLILVDQKVFIIRDPCVIVDNIFKQSIVICVTKKNWNIFDP